MLLQREHRLEQRIASRVALRRGGFDDAFDRQLAMGVRFARARPGPRKQLAKRRVAAQVAPMDDGVHEEAHHVLELEAALRGNRRADEDIVLVGVTSEQHLEGGEERHVQRDARTLGEGVERAHPCGVDAKRRPSAVGVTNRRPQPVGRERERGRRARESLPPVRRQRVELLGRQVLALPRHVVGILNRDGRQLRRPPRVERVVGGPCFAPRNPARVVATHRVVADDDECVVTLGEPDQAGAAQRTLDEVERGPDLLAEATRKLRLARRLGHAREIGRRERELAARRDPLPRLAIDRMERRAQNLVAVHHVLQRAPQSGNVELAGDAPSDPDVVVGAAGLELVEEPQTRLSGRRRRRLEVLHGGSRMLDGSRTNRGKSTGVCRRPR